MAETPNAFSPSQFSNPANPATYTKTLGPELWRDLDGEIDVFVAGAGSGGTFMGTSIYLKKQKESIKTVIVEPVGSILNGGEVGFSCDRRNRYGVFTGLHGYFIF